MDEKRTIDGYAVLHAIRIDGAEQIVAEKDSRYRLYRGERVSTLGIEEYTTVFESGDYLKAMREFTRRINGALDNLGLDRVYRGSPLVDYPLSAEDCVPGGMDADLGKVWRSKRRFFRRIPGLLSSAHAATGGFAFNNARGSRSCQNLYSGEENSWSFRHTRLVRKECASRLGKKKSSLSCGAAPRESSWGKSELENLAR